ncbi:MAG: acylphosphatase [Gammaproteobacteria bacterium]
MARRIGGMKRRDLAAFRGAAARRRFPIGVNVLDWNKSPRDDPLSLLRLGAVQGVYFRTTTRERALGLGLSGWVRNTPDGAVEVLACREQGEPRRARDVATPRARARTRCFRRARARRSRGLPGV